MGIRKKDRDLVDFYLQIKVPLDSMRIAGTYTHMIKVYTSLLLKK
jgi:hypothetical protein